jgi:predicted ATPase/DNA-binding SARP family transcriptional activator
MGWGLNELFVRALGTLQIGLGNQQINNRFRTEKERALLLFLAFQPGRVFRRDYLAELLWPDRPQGAARTNLRQALRGLHRVLQDEPGEPPYFLVTDDSLSFNSECPARLDALDFLRRVENTRTHSHDLLVECPLCATDLKIAFDLYQGEFLEGFFLGESQAYQEWMLLQREACLREYVAVLENLSEQARQARDLPRALRYARLWAQKSPLDEGAHRLVMLLLEESGQRAAALEHFQVIRRILMQELGVEPSPETRRLVENLRASQTARPRQTGPLQLQTNLPVQLTTFTGREAELTWFEGCVQNPVCRLMTLIGLPGVGKTRLALQMATQQTGRFRDGVWFVPVENIHTTDQLVYGIGQVLGIRYDEARDQRNQLVRFIQPRELLIVLDGFEHLIESAELLVEILQQAPGAKFLVTSQVRLEYGAACIREIGGLPYPRNEHEDPREYPSVQLFITRGMRSRPGFLPDARCLEHIVTICRLADGLPLAIELAAAGLRHYTCEEIAAQIKHNLDSLTTPMQDVPDRHRSIRAALDAAWRNLNAHEKEVFAAMSVFEGSFNLDAALKVAGANLELVTALVAKSLLQQDARLRFWLQPLVHQYARQRLDRDAAQAEAVEAAYCHFYLEFVRQHEEHMAKGQELCRCLDDLSDELPNLRKTWSLALKYGWFDEIIQGIEGLRQYFELSGNLPEGESWFQQVVDALEGKELDFTSRLALGQALGAQGWFAGRSGHLSRALELLVRSLVLLEDLETGTQTVFSVAVGRELNVTLNALGFTCSGLGDYAEARRYFQRSLEVAEQAGDEDAEAYALLYLTELDTEASLEDQLAAYRRCLRIFEANQDRRGGLRVLIDLGDAAFTSGNYPQAKSYYESAQSYMGPLDTGWASAAIALKLAAVASAMGRPDEAWQLNQESLEIYQQIGDQRRVSAALCRLGELACDKGNCSEAAKYHDQALRLAAGSGSVPTMLNVMVVVARCYASAGDVEHAQLLLRRILAHPAAQQSTRVLAVRMLDDLAGKVNAPEPRVEVYHEFLLSPFIQDMVESLLAEGERFKGQVQIIDPFDIELRG